MKDPVKKIQERYLGCIEEGKNCVCASPSTVLEDIENLLSLVQEYEFRLKQIEIDHYATDFDKLSVTECWKKKSQIFIQEKMQLFI